MATAAWSEGGKGWGAEGTSSAAAAAGGTAGAAAAVPLPRTMPATGSAMAALATALRATGRTLLQASGEAGAMGLVAPTPPPSAGAVKCAAVGW